MTTGRGCLFPQLGTRCVPDSQVHQRDVLLRGGGSFDPKLRFSGCQTDLLVILYLQDILASLQFQQARKSDKIMLPDTTLHFLKMEGSQQLSPHPPR